MPPALPLAPEVSDTQVPPTRNCSDAPSAKPLTDRVTPVMLCPASMAEALAPVNRVVPPLAPAAVLMEALAVDVSDKVGGALT